MKYLQPAPFHSHKIYRTIQKEKEEDPSTSASQQEASQSGKLNTYRLLHCIRTIFTARFKKKKKEIHPNQHRKQETSQLGKVNTYTLVHSIPTIFTAGFKNKRKKINSRQHRSKKRVNRANKILTSCSIPFAQKKKKEIHPNQHRSTKQLNQSKVHTYGLINFICTIFTA